MTMPQSTPYKNEHHPLQHLSNGAFDNPSLQLVQDFLANSSDERDRLSNAIDLWDSIPRYALSRKKQAEIRLPDGFLPIRKIDFYYRGKAYIAQIRPARIEARDKNGKLTGKTIEYYPSAREELIEHALRKLATEKYAGFFDQPNHSSGVTFSLHRLRQELAAQGHAMTYYGLAEGLDILHYSYISIVDPESDINNPNLISQPYLPMLAKVSKKGRSIDPEAKWFVQFHSLITDSINQITYRQFNYRRLMNCTTQLARWLVSQLVLKYTQASLSNNFEMKLTTIKRDSGLLSGYKRTRDSVVVLDEAWNEVIKLSAIHSLHKFEQRGLRGQLDDVIYTLFPSAEFCAEQKAANRRLNDAKILEQNEFE